MSHAGAGSVFRFLEQEVKLLVVPNLFRLDPHQQDLAEFCDRNNYCEVCYSLNTITDAIDSAMKGNFNSYTKTEFFKASEIDEIIHNRLR